MPTSTSACPGFAHSPLVHASFTDASEQRCVDGLRELAERIPEDRWLVGAGWYHPLWEENPVLPSKESLGCSIPQPPGMHGQRRRPAPCGINAEGMEVLGIDKDTRAPPGVPVTRDENGELTGHFP
ncbi:MAG: hypothetical protein ACLTW9_03820 [Enterocloster sp.]